jgi:N-acetylglucosamine kinase-like BadF-type ATPase
MNKYVIGADGGGTKTEIILAETTGNIIGRIVGGTSNYQVIGGEKLKAELAKLINELLQKNNVSSKNIVSLFFGLAGAGRKSDQIAIKHLFDETDFINKIEVDNDAIIALVGALGSKPGIILIAGTGSICFGKNKKGVIARSGGWGYLLGDEGSGYDIAKQAIIAALKQHDGRGENTALTEILKTKLNLTSIDEIIPLIYQNKLDRAAIANLAPLVFENARQGDSSAQNIIKKTGTDLGELARAVAVRLGFENDKIKLALIGSIFNQKDMLVNEIAKALYDISWDVEVIDPLFSPAIGAVISAMEKGGIFVDDKILANLRESNASLLSN